MNEITKDMNEYNEKIEMPCRLHFINIEFDPRGIYIPLSHETYIQWYQQNTLTIQRHFIPNDVFVRHSFIV